MSMRGIILGLLGAILAAGCGRPATSVHVVQKTAEPSQEPGPILSTTDPAATTPLTDLANNNRSGPAAQPIVEEPATMIVPDVNPAPPGPWSGVVLRVEFLFPELRKRGLGTGFVVRDNRDECYLLTCTHLMDDGSWENRFRLRMHTMSGSRTIESYGSTLHIGKSVELKQARANGRPDLTQDLIIRSVAGDWVQPLALAKDDPKAGDRVWAVGCVALDSPHDERFYPGRIVEIGDGGYIMEKLVEFDPRGFSGGPVVNGEGKVVGNVLAGSSTTVSGACVSAIRRHLLEHDISAD
jgi:S1-C subfamily serine protease